MGDRLFSSALLVASIFGLPFPVFAASDIVATLTPTRPSYTAGEAVEMRLTISNRRSSVVRFFDSYPLFGSSAGGIKLTLADTQLYASAARGSFGLGVGAGGPFRIVPLEPGKSWSVDVYAQRYLPAIPYGTHDISYEIGISLADPTAGSEDIIRGKGTVRLSIVDAGDAELVRIFGEAQERYFHGTSELKREAEEALAASTSPVVIPYLSRLIEEGHSSSAVDALEKFSDNSSAQALIVSLAKSHKPLEASAALRVLQKWNYPLSAEDLSAILSGGDTSVRLWALDFARASKRAAYVSTVSAYASDSNAVVSTYAKRALGDMISIGK
jgi:hypothetical protein